MPFTEKGKLERSVFEDIYDFGLTVLVVFSTTLGSVQRFPKPLQTLSAGGCRQSVTVN